MGVKAVILDLDGTLVINGTSRLRDGVDEMLTTLRKAGMAIIVATTHETSRGRAEAAAHPDLVLTQRTVSAYKGSPQWVHRARMELGLRASEIVWLGDSDLDMRSAVNGKVPYFHACWSFPGYQYGLQMRSPDVFATVVTECFGKANPWFTVINQTGPDGYPVHSYSMTDTFLGGDAQLQDRLKSFLKHGYDPIHEPVPFGRFVAYHLLGSVFTSGLIETADVWTVYPGSTGRVNQSLDPFVTELARLFRDHYQQHILTRHTDSRDSGQSRFAGVPVDFANQVTTIHVNPDQVDRVRGKHVVVVDDFETNGYSLECARQFLYQAGAQRVTGVAIGRYMMKGHGYLRAVAAFKGNRLDWDPFQPYSLDPGLFDVSHVMPNREGGEIDFRTSCERVFPAS